MAENFACCQLHRLSYLLVHACVTRRLALTRSCARIRLASRSGCFAASGTGASDQLLTCIWNRRQWWKFWDKIMPFHLPSHDFRLGQNWVLQVGLSPYYGLVVRAPNVMVKGISGWWKPFYCHALYEHACPYFVDVISIVCTIFIAEKLFCILLDAVTKDRAHTKTS